MYVLPNNNYEPTVLITNLECSIKVYADMPSAQSGRDQDPKKTYNIERDMLAADLTTGGSTGEKPTWPLSVYGPGRDAPRQLLEGALEQSPEEMRLMCYEARAKGQEHDYVSILFTGSIRCGY